MKKNRVSLLVIFISTFCFLSNIQAKDAAKLRIVRTIAITPKGEYYQDPKLSPDGSKVVFEGQNGGLFIWNADGTGPMVTVLPRGKGTRDYVWSPDSKTIAYKRKTGEETKRLSTTLHTFDIQTKQSRVLKNDVPGYGFIRWTDHGIEAKIFVPVKNRETGYMEKLNKVLDLSTKDLKQSNEPFVYYYFDQKEKQRFVIVEDGSGNVLSKIPGYILPLMSAQNDRFLATRGNTYVLNLGGEVLVDLGKADNEIWSEDGQMIIYEIGQAGGPHGQILIASEIYVINADGTGKNQLTDTPDTIEIRPHWSRNASKITYFDASSGTIYVAELEEAQ